MEPFRRILVDVDAGAPAHPALERAVELARRSAAQLTLVDVLTVPPAARRDLPDEFEAAVREARQAQLARLARAVPDVAIEPRLLIGRPATALVEEVQRGGHELLVRAQARDRAAAAAGCDEIGHELVRSCPCPVLLVGPGHPAPRPRLLAAVDTSSDDPRDAALNTRIVELTLLLARLLDGSATIVHAWAPFAEEMLRVHVSDDAFDRYVETARQRASAALAGFCNRFGDRLSGVDIVLRRGTPEAVIAELVAARAIDCVVLGTVARSGIAGLLIGNTAERILRTLPCSVLTVRPDPPAAA